MQKTTQQEEQPAPSQSVFERIGEAQIEGEQKRLARMTPDQRSRDSSLRNIVNGIFTVLGLLTTVPVLLYCCIKYPVARIGFLAYFLLLAGLAYRRKRKGN